MEVLRTSGRKWVFISRAYEHYENPLFTTIMPESRAHLLLFFSFFVFFFSI